MRDLHAVTHDFCDIKLLHHGGGVRAARPEAGDGVRRKTVVEQIHSEGDARAVVVDSEEEVLDAVLGRSHAAAVKSEVCGSEEFCKAQTPP